MTKLSRRTLIKRTSIGVAGAAALGTLTAIPSLAAVASPSQHSTVEQATAAPSGPMIVQVRNFSTGEIGVMYGEKEVILRDPALVSRLLHAAG